jgi:hypothetical protein
VFAEHKRESSRARDSGEGSSAPLIGAKGKHDRFRRAGGD